MATTVPDRRSTLIKCVRCANELIAPEKSELRRPTDRFGNRADRMAHSLGQTNLFSFRIRQMRIA
jgi:hypothetical protein